MKKLTVPTFLNYLTTTFLVLITLIPFYLLVISSVKTEAQIIHHFWTPALPFHFQNFVDAFNQIYNSIINSLIITIGIMVMVLINSILAGYCFARFEFFGKNILYYMVLMLFMIPPFLLLIPQFVLFKDMGLLNTYWAQIFGPAAGSSALATMLTKTFFEGIPKSLNESAEIEGAGEYRILLQIVIPLSLPIIVTVSIIQALLGWNNYIWPLVVTSGAKVQPIILAMVRMVGTQDSIQGIRFAGYIVATIPLMILFVFATKYFVAGITSGAVKG